MLLMFLVEQDYTGEAVNVENFLNVILGNESGVTGGSGKVVKSGPNDNIFIYYADHGATGFMCTYFTIISYL